MVTMATAADRERASERKRGRAAHSSAQCGSLHCCFHFQSACIERRTILKPTICTVSPRTILIWSNCFTTSSDIHLHKHRSWPNSARLQPERQLLESTEEGVACSSLQLERIRRYVENAHSYCVVIHASDKQHTPTQPHPCYGDYIIQLKIIKSHRLRNLLQTAKHSSAVQLDMLHI